jgi:acetyl esterase/lipase
MRVATRHNRRPLVAAVVLAIVASGCTLIAAPEGSAPLRYRDAIFDRVDTTTDLPYGAAPDVNAVAETLRLDLFEPHGDPATARPAVVLVHGGAFSFGDKESPELVDLATYLGRRGFVSVSIDYRLLAPAGCVGPDDPTSLCVDAARGAQHDAQAAVRWLRANASTYRIDPNRIAMGGSSAGGIASLLAAFRPDDPGTSGNPGPSSAIAGAISISGGLPGASTFTDPGDAPTLLFHGTADSILPYTWTVAAWQAARAAGVFSNLELLPDAGHVPYDAYRDLIRGQTANFLYHQLDLAHAAR